jgi:UDP-N-acetylmuramate-alanine ligase
MAQKTVTTLTDDLDGGKAVETVTFGVDGLVYEIDLSARNAKALRGALAPYVGAGRRAPSARVRKIAVRSDTGHDPAAVRAWASSNKVKVSSRGRISADVLAQYRDAGN